MEWSTFPLFGYALQMGASTKGFGALAALKPAAPEGPKAKLHVVAIDPDGRLSCRFPIETYRRAIGGRYPRPSVPEFVLPNVAAIVSFIVDADAKASLSVEYVVRPSFVRLDGRRIDASTVAAVTPASKIELIDIQKRVYRLHVVDADDETFANLTPALTPRAEAKKQQRKNDLFLRRPMKKEADLRVDGWIEIVRGGELVCDGDVTCLGMSLEPGAVLQCKALTTNVLSVDGTDGDTETRVDRVRARFVHTVQRGLAGVIERGAVEADYIQHFGGELNPSWDFARGERNLRRELYATTRSSYVDLELSAIRAAIARGEPIFDDGVWLVPPKS
jgi:hypothetical protein